MDFGITTHFEDQMQCVRRSSNVCNKILDDTRFHKFFKENCATTTKCTIKDFGRLIKELGDEYVVHQCLDPLSRVFFQYKCEQTPEEIDAKMNDIKLVIMIELFCTFLVLSFVLFAK